MNLSGAAWAQLKAITADDFIRALKKDHWSLDAMNGGSMQIYRKDQRRVSVHYHPNKTFGPNLLKALLEDTGWTEAEMRQLKLIK